MGQIGLRARITLAFALGALLISALLMVASLTVSRTNLLSQREQQLTDRAVANARSLTDKLEAPGADAQTLFGSLSTAGKPSALLPDPSNPGSYRPVSFDPKYGAAILPKTLTDSVLTGNQPAIMRFERENEPLVAVGVPLANGNGAYFEVNQLRDIASSLNNLGLTLIGAAALAAAIGAGVGWYASRRVLRPLRDMTDVAQAISVGRLDARLAYAEWADDVDLAPLVLSFNEMVGALQGRIDRDARFASDVSHELRSPLMTLQASLEVLDNARDEIPDRACVALDLLTSDVDRLAQLVEDLLEISRFDAGAVRLELDEVLLCETVRQAVRALSSEPIEVRTQPELEDLVIRCDKRRLVRVLANFLDNGRKYSDGVTSVEVERVRVDPLELADPTEPIDRVRIAVEDRGPGVAESEREKIFDRFNRGEQAGSRGNDLGTGLGLALVSEHARLQGGSVWVEGRSDGESGARFVLELPIIEATDEPEDDEERLDQAAEVTA